MKIQKKTAKLSLLAIVLAISFTLPILAVTAQEEAWILDPIGIDESVPGATWADWARDKPWLKGSGTFEDPYMIKNVVINGEGSNFCIAISNSEVYFEIKDSIFYNTKPSSLDAGNAGIALINTKNGVIFRNQILNNGWQGTEHGVGIFLDGSDGNKIMKNIIRNTAMSGIIIDLNSANNIIQKNIISDNGASGISLGNSANNIIQKNIISDNGQSGIALLQNSDNNIIQKNIISDNGDSGIYLDNSDNNIIVDNYCSENMWGILIWDSTLTTSGSSDDNIITGNECLDNIETGIVIGFAHRNTVSKNLCKGSTWGIAIGNWAAYNIITQNDCMLNIISSPTGSGGIIIYDFAYFNEIRGNNCTDNFENGILVVNIQWTNTIENNLCKKNIYGISMLNSQNQIISGNDIVENLAYGITLSSLLGYNIGNTINNNNFIDNANQAWDDSPFWGTNNWDGNYWSDYPGTDINEDGIGDTDLPWPFNGGSWSIDYYPFMEENGWE